MWEKAWCGAVQGKRGSAGTMARGHLRARIQNRFYTASGLALENLRCSEAQLIDSGTKSKVETEDAIMQRNPEFSGVAYINISTMVNPLSLLALAPPRSRFDCPPIRHSASSRKPNEAEFENDALET